MCPLLKALPAWFLAPVFAAAFQQAPATYTISGTVLEHATNRPLNNVLVGIAPVEHRAQPLAAVTGADGRFLFTNLPRGKYSLGAQRRSGPIQLYQQHEQFSTAIAIGPGLDSENIVFPLQAFARISGTVLDEEGEPVSSAQVQLLRKAISNGAPEVIQSGSTSTSNSGAFHFAHLAPGTYFIAVTAHPWYAQSPVTVYTGGGQNAAQVIEPPSGLDVAYPITYYGDTTDPSAAQLITLGEGASVTAQISVRAVPAVHARVTGFDAQPGIGVGALAIVKGPGGFQIYTGAPLVGGPDGYELNAIAPGHYDVQLQRFTEGNPPRTVRQSVDLSTGSVISFPNRPDATISGQITFESAGQPVKGASLQLSNYRDTLNCPVQPDGSFSCESPPPAPGRYEFVLFNAPGFYVKSISTKGRTNSGDVIDIPAGTSLQLAVLAASVALPKLDGIAVRDGKPMPAVMVLLLPQDPAQIALIRRDQSDSDGTFTLSDIPPGRYTLLAIDDGTDLAYQNPDVMKPYLVRGQSITVPSQIEIPAKVDVLPRQRN
ncbi:MAG: carboxypeptidase regulatory-like domain-containing protein [Acidobacteriaceae bacterium]|nr:carboxypeptidase regulatory-like domain-containing protein [Acidobacteriaceae bacterium]